MGSVGDQGGAGGICRRDWGNQGYRQCLQGDWGHVGVHGGLVGPMMESGDSWALWGGWG